MPSYSVKCKIKTVALNIVKMIICVPFSAMLGNPPMPHYGMELSDDATEVENYEVRTRCCHLQAKAGTTLLLSISRIRLHPASSHDLSQECTAALSLSIGFWLWLWPAG